MHLTFDITQLSAQGNPGANATQFPIALDCWRVTIILSGNGTSGPPVTLIDGKAIPMDRDEQNVVFQLGGAYFNDKPINIKHDLKITFPNKIQTGWIIREFINE